MRTFSKDQISAVHYFSYLGRWVNLCYVNIIDRSHNLPRRLPLTLEIRYTVGQCKLLLASYIRIIYKLASYSLVITLTHYNYNCILVAEPSISCLRTGRNNINCRKRRSFTAEFRYYSLI